MRKPIVLLLALTSGGAMCAQGIPYGYTPSNPTMVRHRVAFYCDSPYAIAAPYFCNLLTDYLDHHTNWVLEKETEEDRRHGFIVRVRGYEEHSADPFTVKAGDPADSYSIELAIERNHTLVKDTLNDCKREDLSSCFAKLQRDIERRMPRKR